MCSTKWPARLGRDAVDLMLAAVTAVAERSFFAVAERCDETQFAKLAEGEPRWIVATVRFTEGDCPGILTCILSEELAHSLFHAFAGEDPLDPPPAQEQLFDLIGECANMICGTWLTRLEDRQTFNLFKPVVRYMLDRSPLVLPEGTMRFTLNDMPLAINVRVTGGASAAAWG